VEAKNAKQTGTDNIQILGSPGAFEVSLQKLSDEDGIAIYRLKMISEEEAPLPPISLKWHFKNKNIKGVWHTNALHEKRLKADWESPSVVSRVSVDAPIICLFSHDDTNVIWCIVKLNFLRNPCR